jgi:hypothetical protein
VCLVTKTRCFAQIDCSATLSLAISLARHQDARANL